MDERERLQRATELEPLAPGFIHEMRHPLMGVLAGLELVARRLHAVAGLREWTIVTDQAKRLEELFRTYYDLFAGAPQKPRPVAVDETVKRAVSLLHLRLRKLGDRFSLSSSSGPVLALGGGPPLLHAVTNLLSNALDALDDGGGSGRLEIRIVRAANEVEVRVSDQGSGIPAAARARLFEPRFTTKPPDKGSG